MIFLCNFTWLTIRYFGHGSGNQYVRSQKILEACVPPLVMLAGCSSGALESEGELDCVGFALDYLKAGRYIIELIE